MFFDDFNMEVTHPVAATNWLKGRKLWTTASDIFARLDVPPPGNDDLAMGHGISRRAPGHDEVWLMPDGAMASELLRPTRLETKQAVDAWALAFKADDFSARWDQPSNFYAPREGESASAAVERFKRVRVLWPLAPEERWDECMCYACSCLYFSKYGQCKHALAQSVAVGHTRMRARFLALYKRRGPGRPSLAVVGGLMVQPGTQRETANEADPQPQPQRDGDGEGDREGDGEGDSEGHGDDMDEGPSPPPPRPSSQPPQPPQQQPQGDGEGDGDGDGEDEDEEPAEQPQPQPAPAEWDDMDWEYVDTDMAAHAEGRAEMDEIRRAARRDATMRKAAGKRARLNSIGLDTGGDAAAARAKRAKRKELMRAKRGK